MAKSAAALIFLQVVAVLAAVSQVSGVAHLFVVNGVSDFAAYSDLDIYINGSRVLCGFGYGQGAGYLQLPAGLLVAQARRTIAPMGLTDGAHHQILLEDDGHYALVASGSMTNSSQYALRLSGGRVDGPNDSSSMATLVFFNLAPGSGYLTLSVDNNVAQVGRYFPLGKTMTKPQFAPTTMHVLWLRDLDSVTFLAKIVVKLQAGLNFFFAFGDVVGGQPASLRAIQPSAAHAPSEC